MGWTEDISESINYIEDNITENLTMEAIAKQALMSPFYFQKGFSILCGFTVGEYIRRRRLTLAASELIADDEKIIDIANKYGYDSPDSFTKAFTRFHEATPTAVRKDGAMIKSFAPLKIKLLLEGGYVMDYKIIEKEEFTVIGVSKTFKYDSSAEEIPKFWTEHYQTGKGEFICGMYGMCIDKNDKSDKFEYLIADDYIPNSEVPPGFVKRVIPKHTWAVFSCKGALPNSLQDINKKIFSEWLPNNKNYKIAADFDIEFYSNPDNYANGSQDENYYCEIWIPIKKI